MGSFVGSLQPCLVVTQPAPPAPPATEAEREAMASALRDPILAQASVVDAEAANVTAALMQLAAKTQALLTDLPSLVVRVGPQHAGPSAVVVPNNGPVRRPFRPDLFCWIHVKAAINDSVADTLDALVYIAAAVSTATNVRVRLLACLRARTSPDARR